MPEEIDHEYTREIVCPHCGYEFSDSWEYGYSGMGGRQQDSGEDTCECGADFEWQRQTEITYSTKSL